MKKGDNWSPISYINYKEQKAGDGDDVATTSCKLACDADV